MLAGKGAHGIGAGGGAVGGGNGRAVKLGNLEQVLASPQLALELAELLDGLVGLHAFGSFCHGGLGLLIECSFPYHILDLARPSAAGWRAASLHSYLPCTQREQNGTRRYARENVLSYSPMR